MIESHLPGIDRMSIPVSAQLAQRWNRAATSVINKKRPP